jgi:HTH-type transcriptional regulator/antitoxin HigA
MTRVTEIENKHEYAKLLRDLLPHVIHTEEENKRYTAALEMLLAKRDRSPEENRIVELLTLLIEDFEERNYSLPPATPRDVVRYLMESNGLRQVDLIDVLGAGSTVSEVLKGKRDLAKSHIERLSQRFNVSPALFFVQHKSASTRVRNRHNSSQAHLPTMVCTTSELIGSSEPWRTRGIANKLLTRQTEKHEPAGTSSTSLFEDLK